MYRCYILADKIYGKGFLFSTLVFLMFLGLPFYLMVTSTWSPFSNILFFIMVQFPNVLSIGSSSFRNKKMKLGFKAHGYYKNRYPEKFKLI